MDFFDTLTTAVGRADSARRDDTSVSTAARGLAALRHAIEALCHCEGRQARGNLKASP